MSSQRPGEPTSDQLRDTNRIPLSRVPTSPAAMMLTDRVLEAYIAGRPTGPRVRPIGPKSLPRQREEIGRIVGGLLRNHYRRGRLSYAQRRPDADIWQAFSAPMGNRAFWGKVNVLRLPGVELVGVKDGIRTPRRASPSGFDGSPAVLWPTGRLLALAESCGVSADTLREDWPFHRSSEEHSAVVKSADLVVLSALPPIDRYRQVRKGDTPPLPIPQPWHGDVAAMAERVAALNERAAAVRIEGCAPPVFQRKFKGDLRLGGRHYALGDENFQAGISRVERQSMRIDGEAIVEVDISASFLSIALALLGIERPPGDPYATIAAPRDAVKAYMVGAFGKGSFGDRWARSVSHEVRALAKAKVIRAAVFDAFPVLAQLGRILPDDLRDTLPASHLSWAVGQHLAFLESEVVADALDAIGALGGVALPLHDSLVVGSSWAERAQEALVDAFRGRFGVVPEIKAK